MLALWLVCWTPGSRSPGVKPGQVNLLCSSGRHFTFTVPLSTYVQMCTNELSQKADEMLGGNIPSRGEGCVVILFVNLCYGIQKKIQLDALLHSCKDLTLQDLNVNSLL